MLNRIATESQEPPPPPASFFSNLPVQKGNQLYTMVLWQHGVAYPLQNTHDWPVSIPGLEGTATADAGEARVLEWLSDAAYAGAVPNAVSNAGAAPSEQQPPLCGIRPAAAPEVAERWLDRSLAPLCAASPGLRHPAGLDNLPGATLRSTLGVGGWEALPHAEPAAAYVAGAAELVALAGAVPALRLPRMPVLETEHTGSVCETPDVCGFARVPAAEPVAAFVAGAAELVAVAGALPELRLPQMPALETEHADAACETPDVCGFARVPAAEPVAAFVAGAAELVAAAGALPELRLPQMPALETEHTDAVRETPDVCGFARVPAAEPVAAFVAGTSELAAAAGALPGLQLPAVAAVPIERCNATSKTPAMGKFARVPAAEPVAALVAASADFELARPAESAGAVLPGLSVAAELDALPAAEEPLVIPAACDVPMAPPQAEPVWSVLQVAAAGAISAAIPTARPVLTAELIRTYVPRASEPRRVPQAEPVMAGVWPRMAEVRVESLETAPEFRLPEIAGAPARLQAPAGDAAPIPAAEPVESWVAAAAALTPVVGAADVRMPSLAVEVPAAGAPAGPAVGPEAEPAEDLVIAASAGPASSPAAVSLRDLELEAETPATVRPGRRQAIAARAAAPESGQEKVVVLRPLSTVRVALPEGRQDGSAVTSIPRPGLFSIEYHTQRTCSTAYARPEWKCANYRPQPPEFTLTAALENLADLVKPKQPLAGVFPINIKGRARTHSAMTEHILRIAAAVMIVTSIWIGAAALKNARKVNLRQDEAAAFATPNRVLTPEAQAARAEAAKSKGPFKWMRQAIAKRASVQVADDFQHGMDRWSAEGQQAPANWRRSPDGYVQTGALALFRPTKDFVDYRLEFFGQIENRSVGWVVRARDDKNYHAMKFTVLERGLRPIIAMVHYNVVDGRPSHRIQIPLNVMVHNNQPFQVAVMVHGKHFVTSVDGEQVDDYREDAMPAGGVGFFSDKGEQARLYWARVTKNDDWLGHVCAFLSGGDTRATADMWPPEIPGGIPSPWNPAGDPNLLAAAWIGLPSIRRNPSSRRHKRCNR